MTKCVITGSGLFTPEFAVSNDELVASFNQYVENYNTKYSQAIKSGELAALQPSSSEFIEKASGIKSRYFVSKKGVLDPNIMQPIIKERTDNENSLQCEMALHAIDEALVMSRKQASDIDAVIVACSNFQRPYPAISVEIQQALGVQGFAYDMNVACSSATFGIQAAADAIKNGHAKCVLTVNPEICSGHLNFCDRDSHFIFGDACTATIIEAENNSVCDYGFEIVGTKLLTKYSNNIRNNFGFLNRTDPETMTTPDKLFYQQGRKVFKEVIPLVVELIQHHLQSHQIEVTDLKRLWLHQANSNMNNLIAQKLLGRDFEPEKVPMILDTYANTSSAGSIIAYHIYNGDLKPGDLGLICSFGAGYSVGNVIVKKVQLFKE